MRGRLPILFAFCLMMARTLVGDPATRWVEQLGAKHYEDREEAMEELRILGPAALDAVMAVKDSPDPEVRMRARELLPWLQYGMQPDWPDDLRRRVVRSETLSEKELSALIHDLDKELGLASAEFLIRNLHGPASSEALSRLQKRIAEEDWQERILNGISRDSPSEAEALLLVALWKEKKDVQGLLQAMGFEALPGKERKKIPSQAVTLLVPLVEEKKFEELSELCSGFNQTEPRELRLEYLQAVALREQGKAEEAEEIFSRAKAFASDQESPHLSAAMMLEKIGHTERAMREYQKVLEIGPVDEVYDMNAHFALGRLYEKKETYGEALASFERGLASYRAEKNKGVAMIGETEEGIEKKIRMLQGLVDPKSRMGDNPVQYGIEMSMKEDRMQDYRKLFDTKRMSVSLEFQPRGLRLLSKDVVTVHWLPDEQKIMLRLNGADMPLEGLPYEWQEEGLNRLLIRSRDMRYFFDLNPEGEAAERVDQFELDYQVVLKLNDQVKALRNPEIHLNGEARDWNTIQKEGIAMDMLPETFNVKIKGGTEDGITMDMEVEYEVKKQLPSFP